MQELGLLTCYLGQLGWFSHCWIPQVKTIRRFILLWRRSATSRSIAIIIIINATISSIIVTIIIIS